ncbi:MAG TPA: guanylate kinase [Fibrobacteria bacterium]|nr:guanylate kinase [Fibrobacteria bacterium]
MIRLEEEGFLTRPGRLIVFSAPSGAGKSTLKDALMGRFPTLRYSVSATTRGPRPGEVDSVHYYFKTPEEFMDMIDRDELVEHMRVHDNFYGTPRAPILKNLETGYSVILDLDVYGKVNFDKAFPDALGILIVPPSLEELERRLVKRNTDNLDTIRVRLRNATQELDFARHRGKYEYTVVNDNFERALEELTGILEKELGQPRNG